MNKSFTKTNSSKLQPHLCLQSARSRRTAWQASELRLAAVPHSTHTVQKQHCNNKLASTGKAVH